MTNTMMVKTKREGGAPYKGLNAIFQQICH